MSTSPASHPSASPASQAATTAEREGFFCLHQSFEDTADGAAGPARLAALREALKRRGLGGYVIPRADAHQNEYVPACEERLAWLTGFTGSAGIVVVLEDEAALFVDGRYTLQAPAQVDLTAFAVVPLAEMGPEKWLETHLPKGASLGVDLWRTTLDARDKLAQAVGHAGGILVGLVEDPLDEVWRDRPAPPRAPVRLLDPRLAGEETPAKLARVQAALRKERVNAALVSDPHATAWLFNIRGGDVAHTPLPLCWSLVCEEGAPHLFIDGGKLSNTVRDALTGVAQIHEPDALERVLSTVAAGRTVRMDQATGPVRLAEVIEAAGGRAVKGADPIAMLKAVKNAAEIAGMRAAHLTDGIALAGFLAWFDAHASSGRLTEIDAVEALETFRRGAGALSDVSFATIAGAGENGAIVHYRVTRSTNRRIGLGELFLLDSGAQYPEGTTDVTRTLAVGEPTEEMRQRFTLVLKGHVALSRAVFPVGGTGAQLDPLARQFLWAAGLDFDHGTGHGVGAGLSVHEGPARISKLGHVPLAAGMILSNEPGYYKAGAYGIRTENLILVEPVTVPGGERPSLGFSTLTLAPYDRRLIDVAMLTPDERAWIDGYHAEVAERLSIHLDAGTREWLAAATAPLGG